MGSQAYHSGASSAASLPPPYAPRSPESGKVFGLIQRNWLKFTAEAEVAEKPPAKHVVKEIEEFLGCGALAKGFLRLQCDTCKSSRLVAFSCKRRGFCPSCCGRRMNEGAAYMVDYVFPHVPVRQWVVSFPIPVRFWMAVNPKLITQTLGIFHRLLDRHYKAAAKNMGISAACLTGAITVVQRFGSALNSNIHYHVLALDGVYVLDKSGLPQFIETPRPSSEDVSSLIGIFQRRMLRALQRRGLVQKLEAENGGDAIEGDESLEGLCQGASVQYRLAMGRPSGRPVRRIGSLGFIGEDPQPTGTLSAIIGGYSMHAGTYVHRNDRAGLERVCRYLLRPPVAEDRLEIKRTPSGNDNVVYKLKSQWSDGTKAILLTGVEFVEKIVAIIPQTRIHGTRFHGVLAPHSAHRKLVVPAAEPAKPLAVAGESSAKPAKPRHPRLRWAQLLSRVFGIDVTQCHCGGKLKVISAIMDEDQIRRILDHLGLPSQIPKFQPA